MSGRALITGAAGFVGRRLATHLRAQGWEVVCTGYPAPEEGLSCDFRDRDSVDSMVARAGEVTHVFHLAAITFVPQAEEDPALAMAVNLTGTIHLCEALRRIPNPPRLLFVGSSDAYGPPQSLPVTEEHPLNPGNAYAISKAAADHYCRRIGRPGVLDCIRLRPFNHTGPGQSDVFVLSSFARQIAAVEAGRQEPILRVGNLDAARDFLHVNDVLRAYELSALHAPPREAYNICSGHSVRIQEALDALLAMSGAAIEVQEDPARMRPSDVPEVRGSHDKLTAATGWRPEIPLETTLRDLLHYWRGELGAAGA